MEMPKLETIQTPVKRVFRKPFNPAIREAFRRCLSFSGSRRGDTYREAERRLHSLDQKDRFRERQAHVK